MADEVSFTTAWLCKNGLDGTAALAEHLAYVHTHGARSLKLSSLDTPWHGAAHGLCSVSAGTTLSDLANELGTPSAETSPEILGEFTQLLTPVLIVPYVAYACQQIAKHRTSLTSGSPETACNADIHCVLFKAKVAANSQTSWLNKFQSTTNTVLGPANTTCTIRIATTSNIQAPGPYVEHRVSIAPGVLELLNNHAQRTYAPATDASRDGAGAGTSDND